MKIKEYSYIRHDTRVYGNELSGGRFISFSLYTYFGCSVPIKPAQKPRVSWALFKYLV